MEPGLPPDTPSARCPVPGMLYGIELRGNFPLQVPLPPAGAARPDHRLELGAGETPPAGDWSAGAPVFASAVTDPSDEPFITLFRPPGGFLLRIPRAGDYYLEDARVTFVPAPGCDWVLAEIYLLGVVLSLWLELHGILVLHAAVVEHGGAGAAFLATNRGGKSSLAAALLRAGARFLSDDLLAAHREEAGWRARSGFPQMRLWPDQAGHFRGSIAGLSPVHPGTAKLRVPVDDLPGGFLATGAPLRALYVPQRREDDDPDLSIRIENVPPGESLMELVRHSFLTRMLHAAGLQPDRLPRLADLARSVPIRRVSYPTGVKHLPGVSDTLLRDLWSL